MEMIVSFPGGARVDAQFGPYTVTTEQPPKAGGTGAAPSPFALFLASLATCAGVFVLGFCRQRDISTEGIKLVQRVQTNPETGMATNVEVEIQVPADFPEKYHQALVRTAEQCLVKKHLEQPPTFEVHTSVVG